MALLTELSINPPNKLIHHSPEILIFLNLSSTGHRNLHQYDFADPFRVICQEHLQSMKFLRYAFDVVKPVHTYHKLDALEFALKGCYAFLNFWLLKTLLELLWIDANGEGTDCDNFALKLDTIGCGRSAPVKYVSVADITGSGYLQNSSASTQKVSGIVVGVKSDKIAV